jgi:glycosyltransferase involved in cell wall biosynthesis
MHVVHLTASPFFGGPERQMLGLADHLPSRFASTFLSFPERGRCAPFLAEARRRGHAALPLAFDTPKIRDAVRELTYLLRSRAADVLVTHSYKPNVLGRVAARRVGIPHVVVSRGWTGESIKIRMYEAMDRYQLRFADRVVAVSEAQAQKVLRCGVNPSKLEVIRNSARPEAFTTSASGAADRLRANFPQVARVSQVVLAAGRLSPEKGFHVLVDAARDVLRSNPNVGFVLFGEGKERRRLERAVAGHGVSDRFVLPGFASDLDTLLPGADLVVVPSFTEGLPNVALEAAAAGVPVVATAVGGNPEVVVDGSTGRLLPAGDPAALAAEIIAIVSDAGTRTRYGAAAREMMTTEFSFASQARRYVDLFESLRPAARAAA